MVVMMCCCVDDRSGNKTAADSLILFTSSVLTEHGGETIAGENTKPLFSLSNRCFSPLNTKHHLKKTTICQDRLGTRATKTAQRMSRFRTQHTARSSSITRSSSLRGKRTTERLTPRRSSASSCCSCVRTVSSQTASICS